MDWSLCPLGIQEMQSAKESRRDARKSPRDSHWRNTQPESSTLFAEESAKSRGREQGGDHQTRAWPCLLAVSSCLVGTRSCVSLG